jgi:type IV pilus assembly protein PilC
MPSGQVVSETINAPSMAEATTRARAKGGYLLNVTKAPGADGDILSRMRNARIESLPGLKDIMDFSKQLAVMVKAGISITDAIGLIAQEVKNQRFARILKQIRNDVESGQPFSNALAKHPKVFSAMYVNMVRASELSGTFAHMLGRIVDYLEHQHETRRMVRGAMIYPLVLFVMSIAAMVFLLTWVVPRFMVVFKGKEALLPAPTKALLVLSNFMTNQWYVLIGVVVLLAAGLYIFLQTKVGKEYFDRFKLKIPLINRMLRALYITRSLQAMGELINAGVPIMDTLQITADISGHQLYHRLWMRVRNAIKEGKKLVHELGTGNLMPAAVIQMISAGEESGRLGEVLDDVSDFYNKELKDTIKTVTGLLEPAMIVFMGVVVGFIAISIIMPIFKMQKVLAQ